MSAQVQLEMQLKAGKQPAVTASDVEALEALLAKSGTWMKAKEFTAPWTERKLRAVANASAGRIISGQQGYKLTWMATIEEVQHAAAWLRNQATAMQRRALDIDRVYHRKVRQAV